jgi:hypothetical protein
LQRGVVASRPFGRPSQSATLAPPHADQSEDAALAITLLRAQPFSGMFKRMQSPANAHDALFTEAALRLGEIYGHLLGILGTVTAGERV